MQVPPASDCRRVDLSDIVRSVWWTLLMTLMDKLDRLGDSTTRLPIDTLSEV